MQYVRYIHYTQYARRATTIDVGALPGARAHAHVTNIMTSYS